MATLIRIAIPVPALLVLVWCSTVIAADWPHLRGPNGNGIVNAEFTPVTNEPDVVWKATGPKGNGGVVVEDGAAFVFGTGKINLLCLDAQTGETKWAKENLGEWHGNHTPAVVDGRVYIQTWQNAEPVAWCFSAATGSQVWKKELPTPAGKRPWGHAGSPLVLDDVVVLNAGAGVALKRDDGEVVWKFDGLPGLATPVLFTQNNEQRVALFLGDHLIARDLVSGAERWSIPWKTDSAVNAHQPLIFDEKVLINSGYGLGRAMFDVSGDTPRELWQFDKGSGHAYAASILHDGVVYGMFQNGLACLEPRDGSLKWRYRGAGSVLLIGEHIVSLSERGILRIGPITKESWSPSLEVRIGSGQWRNNPAFWNGKLIAKSESGEIVSLQVAR